jgi:hypothetical protein
MDFAMGVHSVVAHASGRMVGTDQVGLCHFQLPYCIGRLAVRLFSVPLPVSTNAIDRAREAGRPACPLLVVRLGRNAGCHLVLDIIVPPFRMIADGHVSAQLVLGLMGRVLRCLAPRLDKPFSLDRRAPPGSYREAKGREAEGDKSN